MTMEPTPPISEPQPQAPPPSTSATARLLNVFAVPGDVFDEVKASPPSTANWLVPALIACVIGIIASILIFSNPAIVQNIREQQAKTYDSMVKSGKMTQADADRSVAAAERFSGPTMLKVWGSLGAVMAAFGRIFWWALVLWLLGRVVLKARFGYLKAAEVAGLASMITLLGGIVALLLTISLGKQTAPSLALFIDSFDQKNKVHLMLAATNPFTIWLLGVLGAGLARLTDTPFTRALLVVLAFWLILQGLLIFVLSGLMRLITG